MPVQAAVQTNVRVCTHIKVTGIRCGSPALRGEQFCYFHQRMVRGVRTPPHARLHPIALIESGEAIQASLMEVINALIRNQIDTKRAELILRALHIAVKNAHRVRFESAQGNMVKEIPTYPTPEQPEKVSTPTNHVGTDAFVRPPRRSENLHAEPLTFEEQLSRIPETPPSKIDPTKIDPTHAKPPQSVKETDAASRRAGEALKERKIAAHRVSGG